MEHYDEPGHPTGGGNNHDDETAPAPAEQRLRDAERENARLRAELADLRVKYEHDRVILEAVLLDRIPFDDAEFVRLGRERQTFSELLRELEAEFGLGSKP